MAQQTINVGAAPNDGTGTPLRTAFQYTNSNFSELYTALGGGSGLPGASTQVLFNNGTNVAGDAGLVYNSTTDALTIGGNVQAASATISGDLTVDTSTLKVDSANNHVSIGTTVAPVYSSKLRVEGGVEIHTSQALNVQPGNTNPYEIVNRSAGGFAFYHTGATLGMTLTAAGNLSLASGNLVMSTSGKGIDFSATASGSGTMTSELLNDYEEGTWTIGLTFGGASVGMTGTFAGRYTKVGRAVTINGIITLTAKGSSTGLARITGLPFVSANAAGEYTAISIRLDRVSFSDAPCGYIGPNVSVVELENTTNAGTVTSLTEANFINTSVVIINSTYTV